MVLPYMSACFSSEFEYILFDHFSLWPIPNLIYLYFPSCSCTLFALAFYLAGYERQVVGCLGHRSRWLLVYNTVEKPLCVWERSGNKRRERFQQTWDVAAWPREPKELMMWVQMRSSFWILTVQGKSMTFHQHNCFYPDMSFCVSYSTVLPALEMFDALQSQWDFKIVKYV